MEEQNKQGSQPATSNMPPSYQWRHHAGWAAYFWVRLVVGLILAAIIFVAGFALGRITSFGRYGHGMMMYRGGAPMMRANPYYRMPSPMMQSQGQTPAATSTPTK